MRMSEYQKGRAIDLLRAAANILSKSDEAQSTEIFYDEAWCDGLCLRDDIYSLLEDLGKLGKLGFKEGQ